MIDPLSFNTQPRGGGCGFLRESINSNNLFQHTAARRRLLSAGNVASLKQRFNTQPRGGGCIRTGINPCSHHSFNTQPRGGGCVTLGANTAAVNAFQHTAARRRLPLIYFCLET